LEENAMKSIVIYATKYGSAEKAAGILKSGMEGQVHQVNIMKQKAPVLDEYDNVILGGSIYMGRIQKKITDYITANLPVLLNKRIGLYICAGLPDPETRAKELAGAFNAELYEHAVCKEIFGHELNYEKMGFLDKLIMKAVKGDKNSSSEFYQDKIEAFAKAMSRG
jgi:menaquinone-dependent protoporphyrinogen oxidase